MIVFKTPEPPTPDEVIGYFRFDPDGKIYAYDYPNHHLRDVGEFWFEWEADYPDALKTQVWPYGYRSFYMDIVGTGEVIRLEGINRREDYVLLKQ